MAADLVVVAVRNKLRILVSGASGFLGASIFSYFESKGHTVVSLTRGHGGIYWNPDQGLIEKELLEGFDTVLHFVGEPIYGLWTPAKKRKILLSRTVSTWFLSTILSQLLNPPSLFISASAVGYYGDRSDEILKEESSSGQGFLPLVCKSWEEATQPIAARGARTILARLGIVMDPEGGMLRKLTPLYRMGFGPILGSGEQWMSWISLFDFLRAIEHCQTTELLQGAVNFVSPSPIKQKDLASLLSKKYHRPCWLRLPKPLLKMVLGSFAEEVLLSSTRALPANLINTSFSFKFSEFIDFVSSY